MFDNIDPISTATPERLGYKIKYKFASSFVNPVSLFSVK
jgi:hypothetical protein